MELQHMETISPSIAATLETVVRQIVRDEMAHLVELPDEVYDYAAAAEIITRYGSKPIHPRTVGNYARAGKIPCDMTRTGRNYQVVFSVPDLLRWDAAGRPNVAELEKD